VLIFVAYLWRAGQAAGDDEEEFVGAAALIVAMPQKARRVTVVTMFVVSAAIILLSAEPFAEALVASGSALGIDSYFLVQWLAPLASEAPEFIIAAMFALRGMGGAAIGTLIASKVNQWSLLVGSLPIAHFAGGGGLGLPLDGRQIEEFTLTATQTILGVAIILALRFHWAPALGLAALFGLQFFVTDTSGRYILSAIQAVLAIVFLILHRRDILPTLAAPFRRPQPIAGCQSGRRDRRVRPLAVRHEATDNVCRPEFGTGTARRMTIMPRPAVTRMVEDYVTLIWKAYEWPGGRPATTDLAEQLGVTASTVSANLKKLARDGYIDYEPYGQITLTDAGAVGSPSRSCDATGSSRPTSSKPWG
jgi:DNA-binding transcriptional ArsR family regulator